MGAAVFFDHPIRISFLLKINALIKEKVGQKFPYALRTFFCLLFQLKKNRIRLARTNNQIIILYHRVQFSEINLEFNIPTEFHT